MFFALVASLRTVGYDLDLGTDRLGIGCDAGEFAMATAGEGKAASSSTAPNPHLAAATGRGCCTLIGEGPDEQHEGLTRDECRLLAAREGRNFQWVPGQCAEPD